MTSRSIVLLALVLGALAGGSQVWAQEPWRSASVLSIGDGDTIKVVQAGQRLTVRLACIDAPEMAQSPDGRKARQQLQRLLSPGQRVQIGIKTIDRYGRSVAEVVTTPAPATGPEGRRPVGEINVGLAMVAAGQAFVYGRYLSACDQWAYRQAEDRARNRHLGIWQVPGGITPPWEFRHHRPQF